MTFTYDDTLALPLDRVRLRIGDTDPSRPLRQDETVAALIAALGEVGAVEVLASSLAVEYAQRPDSLGADGQTISWSKRVTTWLEIAARARTERLAEASSDDGSSSTLTSSRPVRSDVAPVGEYVRGHGDVGWGLRS